MENILKSGGTGTWTGNSILKKSGDVSFLSSTVVAMLLAIRKPSLVSYIQEGAVNLSNYQAIPSCHFSRIHS